MRARSIKPGICDNEILGTADPFYTLLFERLWMMADREGRLEDRPLRIKAKAFPYREGLDVEPMLVWLHDHGFIIRYTVAGERYIQIVTFDEHQKPHQNEKPSVIPPVPAQPEPQASTTKVASEHNQGTKRLALTPSSLTPDSPFSGLRERRAQARTDAEKVAFVASLKSAYPDGTYRQSEWLNAEREIDRRIDDGYTEQQLRDGTVRYAQQCHAKGNIGTQFVLSPAKFFAGGPQPKFLEPYPLPAVRAGPVQRVHRDAPTTAELEALEASRAEH